MSYGASTESSEVLSLREDGQRHPPQPTADLEPTETASEASNIVLPLLPKLLSKQVRIHSGTN